MHAGVAGSIIGEKICTEATTVPIAGYSQMSSGSIDVVGEQKVLFLHAASWACLCCNFPCFPQQAEPRDTQLNLSQQGKLVKKNAKLSDWS